MINFPFEVQGLSEKEVNFLTCYSDIFGSRFTGAGRRILGSLVIKYLGLQINYKRYGDVAYAIIRD